jgi:hypothetical protein
MSNNNPDWRFLCNAQSDRLEKILQVLRENIMRYYQEARL